MSEVEFDRSHCEKHKWMYGRYWYLAIAFVILSGYAFGGIVPFGIQFLGWWPELSNPNGRFILTLSGVGVLGATMYCNYFFAADANKAMYMPHLKPPNFLDPFGYGMGIVGGAVTGPLLVLAVRTGFFLTMNHSSTGELRMSAAALISFCGGLATYRVRSMFARFVEKIMQPNDTGKSVSYETIEAIKQITTVSKSSGKSSDNS